MQKSVYSLVLMDSVVKAVDRVAYTQKTNRSNMINRILAEYCSCITPEMRIKDIFSHIQALIDTDRFQYLHSPSDSVLAVRSALDYKYNPSIRYSVELYRNCELHIGVLRVSLRTQNPKLIDFLSDFFGLWSAIELDLLKRSYPDIKPETIVDSGKFERKFAAPEIYNDCESNRIGNSIASYLDFFDTALKSYFQDCAEHQNPKPHMESIYRTYLKKNKTIL